MEFSVIDESCYFCKHPKTIKFHEDFVFCPDCSAIYIFGNVLESECDLIGNAPVLFRHPWFDRDTDKSFIYRTTDDDVSCAHRCSECSGMVVVDEQ